MEARVANRRLLTKDRYLAGSMMIRGGRTRICKVAIVVSLVKSIERWKGWVLTLCTVSGIKRVLGTFYLEVREFCLLDLQERRRRVCENIPPWKGYRDEVGVDKGLILEDSAQGQVDYCWALRRTSEFR
jgi:hypothetical protein